MHTQKTAGTTLVNLARVRYGGDLISHGDYLDRSKEEIQNISFVSGHFGFDFARPFMRGRYSFTFLRNPIDRVLSFYYFCRSRDPKEYPIYALSREVNLEGFLRSGLDDPFVRVYLWNQQTWQLACGSGNPQEYSLNDFSEEILLRQAIDNLSHFSDIGFLETFEKDLSTICTALSLPVPNERMGENMTKHPSQVMLSQTERMLAQQLTYLDDELYRTAWAQRRANQQLPEI